MSEPAVELEAAEGPRLFPYLPTEPIEGDHIYVSTFALAWRKLRELAGGEVRVEGAPAWLDAVAGSAISEADVPPKTLVTVAGFGPPAAEEVRREMSATFGAAAPPSTLPALAPDGLLVFAHLQVGLEFEKPFQLEKKVGLLFEDVRVKHFRCPKLHADTGAIAAQVVVHHYGSRDDFVVELLARSHETRLLVARTPGRAGLAARVAHTLAHAGRVRPNAPVGIAQRLMMSQDTFSIPLVRVKEARLYGELTGRRIRGARDLGEMDTAMQDVKLLLDERGVKLISTFTVATKSIRPPAPRAPYDIVCDGPFLLIVIGNGSAEPLAAAAVETPRWLIPISEPDDVPAAEDPEIQAYSPEIEAFMKQFEQKS